MKVLYKIWPQQQLKTLPTETTMKMTTLRSRIKTMRITRKQRDHLSATFVLMLQEML